MSPYTKARLRGFFAGPLFALASGMAAGLLVLLVVGNADEPEAPDPCAGVEIDTQVYNLCENANNCSYTYDEVHDLIHRMADCKLQEAQKPHEGR